LVDGPIEQEADTFTSGGSSHKPDCDNIAKIVCDALNGIAYKDDSQIFDVKISKVYGVDEKLIVKISYLED
jgi:Holliday junction resolvase RusA-like endonuclease